MPGKKRSPISRVLFTDAPCVPRAHPDPSWARRKCRSSLLFRHAVPRERRAARAKVMRGPVRPNPPLRSEGGRRDQLNGKWYARLIGGVFRGAHCGLCRDGRCGRHARRPQLHPAPRHVTAGVRRRPWAISGAAPSAGVRGRETRPGEDGASSGLAGASSAGVDRITPRRLRP